MELRHLRYFVAVAEELHFGRAAARLHVAQPSVSQQIRALELDVGVRLLDRDRRRVRLTEAGAAFLEDARDVLDRADRAAEVARAVAAGERGRLRLSLTRSLTAGVAAATLEAFRARHPDADLRVGVGFTALNVRELLAGEIDVAWVRPPVDEPRLEVLELGHEPVVAAVPAGHRLARRRRIAREELAGEPLVWWPQEHGPGMWRRMLDEVYGPGAEPEIVRFEPEEERMISAVADRAGVTLITLARSRMLGIPGVRYVRFRAPEPTVGIGVAWRAGDQSPQIRRFVLTARATSIATPPDG